MPSSENEAINRETVEKSDSSELTDVYISVFFDGTGNNMFEQINKGKHLNELREKASSARELKDFGDFHVIFSIVPNLFSSYVAKKSLPHVEKNNNTCSYPPSEQDQFGMNNYYEQRIQAEEEYTIKDDRGDKDAKDIKDNGGLKYSNIAILRSLVSKNEIKEKNNKTASTYSLYIEGSGTQWDTGNKIIGLGMGTGRTGVVGLVSKAVVFVREYLCSSLKITSKDNVKLHFAIFGFSRGATCGRLFSSLIVRKKNSKILCKEFEFEQYLPKNTNYYDNCHVKFLDDFNNKTVDFLGIYDTVSSIGLLQKKDNSTNYGINNYEESPENGQGGEKWYSNSLQNNDLFSALESKKAWDDARKHHNYHRFNVVNYGLDPYTDNNVKHTFHICALDEFRENFALVDLGDNMSEHHCTEIYMPGCHSDIGGGYMYNDKIQEHILRKKIGQLSSCMISSSDPRDFSTTGPLTQYVLNELGWINRTTNKYINYKQYEMPFNIGSGTVSKTVEMRYLNDKTKELNEYTEGQTTIINETDEIIKFRHFTKEGYSNISLKMMMDRVKGEYGLKDWGEFMPFTKNIPNRFNISKIRNDKILDNIMNKWDKVSQKEGKRYWIIPDRDDEYVYLRNNYLHFSCTDANLTNIVSLWQWADIGNAPNWVGNWLLNDKKQESGDNATTNVQPKASEKDSCSLKYILCRLVYRGNSNEWDLHYWNENIFKTNDEKVKL